MHVLRAVVRLFWILGLFCALCAPIIAQVHPPGEPPDRPDRPGIVRPTPTPPSPAMTPMPLPTLGPAFPTPPVGAGARTYPQAVLGPRRPLSSLPSLPPPVGTGSLRHTLSANGESFGINTNLGSCTTTVGTIYNTGCQITASSINMLNGNYQDYYIDANTATAATIGGTYTNNNDPGFTLTLNNPGTVILAVFNTGTNTWDTVVYLTVGGGTYFQTFSDNTLNVPATQFVANAGNTVYISASGINATDSYVVYAEYTSVAATCVFSSPAQIPAPSANQLCNPANSAGQTAPGGSITVSWPLTAALNPGTYSIVLYDKSANKRLAQRQIVLTKNGAAAAITLTPTGGNASPAPPPAGTASSVFAYNNSTDQSDSNIATAATSLTANHGYQTVVSDPNGTVISNTARTSTAAGALNWTFNFSAGLTPGNYVGHTYTYSILDNTTKTVTVAKSFQLLGYNVLTQFTSPFGTSLVVPLAGTTSGLMFTNNAETLYGVGNGDPIAKIQWNTYPAGGKNGFSVTLGAGSSACGAGCQTQTVTDTKGASWTVTSICSGAGTARGCNVLIVPVVGTTTLPVNASITIPNITFNDTTSGCTAGCSASTTELPADGLTWSTDGDASSSNPIYLTNANGSTYSGTGHIILYGNNNGTLTAGPDVHNFTPRFNQSSYAANEPSVAPGGAFNVYALTFKNTSSTGTVTKLMLTFPTAFSPANTINQAQVDGASPTAWAVSACPAGSPGSALCLTANGGNAGVAVGATQTIYVDISPPPANDFAYTDATLQAVLPRPFSATADGTVSLFVPNTTNVDTFAMGSYSLDQGLITPSFSPTSEGTSTNNNVTVSVANAPSGSTPYPDYLDLFVIDLPTANTLSSISVLTPGFSYLGTTAPGGGLTRYWFGLCAGQMNAATQPPNNNTANCGAAAEQSSIAPGGTFSFTANLQTGASNITAIEYAHGANGNGWTTARNFIMTVSGVSAIAGFKSVGTYGSPSAVTSNTQPTVGADTDTTYGNSYIYEIKNTGSSAITSATITVPGLNTGGANGADSAGTPWTITAAPVLSGTGSAGCTVSSFTSAQANGTNGSIVITGCTGLGAGKVLDVSFPGKAPYNVNYNYQFPTVVNGAVNASEAWFSDTIVKVVLTGSINVQVNPSNPGPGGSTPVVSCPGCAFDMVLNQIQFRNIANNSTGTYTDVMRVSVLTDSGSSNSWNLSVSSNNNPANSTGSPSNELLTSIDLANSTSGAGLLNDAAAYAVVPTAGSLQLVHAPTGTTARRLPFDVIQNFQISMGAEATVPQTAVLTYTFIAN